jgi:hypothetical protein
MFSHGREPWVATVAEFERSKLTQAEFALRRGVPVSTLRSWIYKSSSICLGGHILIDAYVAWWDVVSKDRPWG